jgi:hypothetical protein
MPAAVSQSTSDRSSKRECWAGESRVDVDGDSVTPSPGPRTPPGGPRRHRGCSGSGLGSVPFWGRSRRQGCSGRPGSVGDMAGQRPRRRGEEAGIGGCDGCQGDGDWVDRWATRERACVVATAAGRGPHRLLVVRQDARDNFPYNPWKSARRTAILLLYSLLFGVLQSLLQHQEAHGRKRGVIRKQLINNGLRRRYRTNKRCKALSKSSTLTGVWVQVPPRPLEDISICSEMKLRKNARATWRRLFWRQSIQQREDSDTGVRYLVG